MHSALYEGWVRHRRFAPVANAFRYRLYMLYLDLAELPRAFDAHGLWSHERRNLAWFCRADYLGPGHVPLDRAVRDLVQERTGRRPRGPIRMLTQIRTFGWVFNPVTFYYCFDAGGEGLEAVVSHITNTPWNERHAYVHAADGPSAGRVRDRFRKAFHVSPFMRMDQDYDWHFGLPGERLAVHMETREDGTRRLDATLALRRRPLDGHTLGRVLLTHPLMTFKVIAAIHWQALRLWWKRCPFVPHPRHRRGGDHDRDARPASPEAPHAARGPAPGPRPRARPAARTRRRTASPP